VAYGNLFTQAFSKKLSTEDNFGLSNEEKAYFSAAVSLNWLFLAHFE
jgi:hypothetical protein|tara:strand:- start:900 stop:1040 length:141 start_codon:yes stop_codon:yes gene_type:complete